MLKNPGVLLIVVLSLACARQNSPTGGEKDVTPPMVLQYDPPVFTTGFSENRFELEFDEYIQVKNLSEQLIISPPLSKPPEYTLRGKKLIIEWEDTLKENTTYQFNFGSSVADITESNANTDLLYVFSTGSFIDSLAVKGRFQMAQDNIPIEGAAVMLYRNTEDSLPLTTNPDFFALTNANGEFYLRYLPEGEFKLFVITEESSNYRYDGPPERIGFLEGTVPSAISDSTLNEWLIAGFMEDDTTQYVSSRESFDYGFYSVSFNLPVEDPQIKFIEPETQREFVSFNYLNEEGDTLKSWLTQTGEGFEEIEEIDVLLYDGRSFYDTSAWYPEIDPKFRQKPDLKVSSNLERNSLGRYDDVMLSFSNPIADFDTSYITLLEDSIPIKPEEIRESLSNLNLFFLFDAKSDSRYQLILDEGAVVDVFGVYNDSIDFNFSLEDAEYYGNVTVFLNDSLLPTEENPIYEFSTESGKVLSSGRLNESNELVFENLNPGKYEFQITLDRNGNGKWDTGNYELMVQPERRILYSEPIEVRSNWDLEVKWTPVPEVYSGMVK